jgi:hypothetical protein
MFMIKLFDWLDHPEKISERTAKHFNLFVLLFFGGMVVWAFAPLFQA